MISFLVFIIFKIILIIINFTLGFKFHKNLITQRKIKNFNKNHDAVLLMTPTHGNIGDQAITLAETKFLREIFPNITSVYNLENFTNYIKNNNTIIFLQGGGNLGWTYNYEEENRRRIIKAYQNNNIIILPQTIYFDKNHTIQQNISSNIYSNHSKLIIMVREKVSFMIANDIFRKNKILLIPDIVTYLNGLINLDNMTRNGALFLIRDDSEKYLDKNLQNDFISLIKKEYNKCDIIDNILISHIHSLNETEQIVTNRLKFIAHHEIVITDRLHGMIFSAITQTSCVVINNYNHKISSSYEWFKDLDYIKMIKDNNINEFQTLIDYFKNKKTLNLYNKAFFNNYYNLIRETIINLV